jgi:hypothetical protein
MYCRLEHGDGTEAMVSALLVAGRKPKCEKTYCVEIVLLRYEDILWREPISRGEPEEA